MISMITKLLVGLTPLVLAGDADIFKGNDNTEVEAKVSKNTSDEDYTLRYNINPKKPELIKECEYTFTKISE